MMAPSLSKRFLCKSLESRAEVRRDFEFPWPQINRYHELWETSMSNDGTTKDKQWQTDTVLGGIESHGRRRRRNSESCGEVRKTLLRNSLLNTLTNLLPNSLPNPILNPLILSYSQGKGPLKTSFLRNPLLDILPNPLLNTLILSYS